MISIDQLFAKKSSWQFSRYPKKLGHNLYYPYGWFRNLAPTRDSPFSRTLPPRFQPRGRWLNESHLSVETAGKWKQGKLQTKWSEIFNFLRLTSRKTHGSSQDLGSSLSLPFLFHQLYVLALETLRTCPNFQWHLRLFRSCFYTDKRP